MLIKEFCFFIFCFFESNRCGWRRWEPICCWGRRHWTRLTRWTRRSCSKFFNGDSDSECSVCCGGLCCSNGQLGDDFAIKRYGCKFNIRFFPFPLFFFYFVVLWMCVWSHVLFIFLLQLSCPIWKSTCPVSIKKLGFDERSTSFFLRVNLNFTRVTFPAHHHR